MSALLPILVKEARHILRDRRSLIAALVQPLLMLLLFGFAINLDIERVDLAVIDRDRTPAARSLIASLASDGVVQLVARPQSEAELERMLDLGEVRVGVIIPPGYQRDLEAGRDAPVQVLVDGAEASFAALALGHLTNSLRGYTLRDIRSKLRTAGLPGAPPGLSVRPRVFFNEALDSRWFVIPGLIGVIIMQLAALLTSQCVAREYERNTIEQLLVSPVSGPALMLGKLAPYVLLGVLQVGVVTALSYFVFHVPIRGSLLTLSAATLLYLIGAMAMGLLFSAALKSQQLAMQVAVVATTLPSILLSGFVFPIENMPAVLQALSYAVPARYYIEITRGLFLKGVGLDVLWPDMLAMVIFAVVLIGASASRFRRSL